MNNMDLSHINENIEREKNLLENLQKESKFFRKFQSDKELSGFNENISSNRHENTALSKSIDVLKNNDIHVKFDMSNRKKINPKQPINISVNQSSNRNPNIKSTFFDNNINPNQNFHNHNYAYHNNDNNANNLYQPYLNNNLNTNTENKLKSLFNEQSEIIESYKETSKQLIKERDEYIKKTEVINKKIDYTRNLNDKIVKKINCLISDKFDNNNDITNENRKIINIPKYSNSNLKVIAKTKGYDEGNNILNKIKKPNSVKNEEIINLSKSNVRSISLDVKLPNISEKSIIMNNDLKNNNKSTEKPNLLNASMVSKNSKNSINLSKLSKINFIDKNDEIDNDDDNDQLSMENQLLSNFKLKENKNDIKNRSIQAIYEKQNKNNEFKYSNENNITNSLKEVFKVDDLEDLKDTKEIKDIKDPKDLKDHDKNQKQAFNYYTISKHEKEISKSNSISKLIKNDSHTDSNNKFLDSKLNIKDKISKQKDQNNDSVSKSTVNNQKNIVEKNNEYSKDCIKIDENMQNLSYNSYIKSESGAISIKKSSKINDSIKSKKNDNLIETKTEKQIVMLPSNSKSDYNKDEFIINTVESSIRTDFNNLEFEKSEKNKKSENIIDKNTRYSQNKSIISKTNNNIADNEEMNKFDVEHQSQKDFLKSSIKNGNNLSKSQIKSSEPTIKNLTPNQSTIKTNIILNSSKESKMSNNINNNEFLTDINDKNIDSVDYVDQISRENSNNKLLVSDKKDDCGSNKDENEKIINEEILDNNLKQENNFINLNKNERLKDLNNIENEIKNEICSLNSKTNEFKTSIKSSTKSVKFDNLSNLNNSSNIEIKDIIDNKSKTATKLNSSSSSIKERELINNLFKIKTLNKKIDRINSKIPLNKNHSKDKVGIAKSNYDDKLKENNIINYTIISNKSRQSKAEKLLDNNMDNSLISKSEKHIKLKSDIRDKDSIIETNYFEKENDHINSVTELNQAGENTFVSINDFKGSKCENDLDKIINICITNNNDILNEKNNENNIIYEDYQTDKQNYSKNYSLKIKDNEVENSRNDIYEKDSQKNEVNIYDQLELNQKTSINSSKKRNTFDEKTSILSPQLKNEKIILKKKICPKVKKEIKHIETDLTNENEKKLTYLNSNTSLCNIQSNNVTFMDTGTFRKMETEKQLNYIVDKHSKLKPSEQTSIFTKGNITANFNNSNLTETSLKEIGSIYSGDHVVLSMNKMENNQNNVQSEKEILITPVKYKYCKKLIQKKDLKEIKSEILSEKNSNTKSKINNQEENNIEDTLFNMRITNYNNNYNSSEINLINSSLNKNAKRNTNDKEYSELTNFLTPFFKSSKNRVLYDSSNTVKKYNVSFFMKI